MLHVENLVVAYGTATVLHGISLEVRAGEAVAIVGSNGAGKSTTLRAISGLVRPARGQIRFDGQRIHDLPPHRIVELGIAHVPEGRRILADQSVEDNLWLGAYCRWRVGEVPAIRQDIEAMIDRFPLIGRRRRALAGTLSGGEQQILAIARALMVRPKLLMLDEPSLGLAPTAMDDIFAAITAERKRGLTILLVEQLAYRALEVADRAYVLTQGAVSLSGPSGDVLRETGVQRAYLGSSPTSLI